MSPDKIGLRDLRPMQEVTERQRSMTPDDNGKKVRKPKASTMGVPPSVKAALQSLKIVDTEPDYSVIQRLLEEHDLRAMQKVVLRRVR